MALIGPSRHMSHIANMDRDNSVFQKGEESSIKPDAEKSPQLKQMIQASKGEYKKGKGMSTSGLLSSLSAEDFE